MSDYIEKSKNLYNLIKIWFPYFIFCLIIAYFTSRTCDPNFVDPYCDTDPLFGHCDSGCNFDGNLENLLWKCTLLFIFGLTSKYFFKHFQKT